MKHRRVTKITFAKTKKNCCNILLYIGFHGGQTKTLSTIDSSKEEDYLQR